MQPSSQSRSSCKIGDVVEDSILARCGHVPKSSMNTVTDGRIYNSQDILHVRMLPITPACYEASSTSYRISLVLDAFPSASQSPNSSPSSCPFAANLSALSNAPSNTLCCLAISSSPTTSPSSPTTSSP